ncbi:MAG: NUDIX hydrolase [Patescibacteria group bacterium]
MENIFRFSQESPFHLSVGAVLYNEEGLIATHYFQEFHLRGEAKYENIFLLMRETVESGESLEVAVERGLREEIGAEGKIEQFLGTIVSYFEKNGIEERIEKTTVYFLVKLSSLDLTRRLEDYEVLHSELEWHTPDSLIEKMTEQGKRYSTDRNDINEEAIVKRAKRYIKT